MYYVRSSLGRHMRREHPDHMPAQRGLSSTISEKPNCEPKVKDEEEQDDWTEVKIEKEEIAIDEVKTEEGDVAIDEVKTEQDGIAVDAIKTEQDDIEKD